MKTHAYSKNLAPKRRRKKDSTSEHYVDNAKLYEVMEEYIAAYKDHKKRKIDPPKIPEYVGDAIIKIARGLASRDNFSKYIFREEMIGDGVENCITYIHNFDPKKSKYPFTYFTVIIYYAYIRRIQKEKKDLYTKFVAIKRANLLGATAGQQSHDTGKHNSNIEYSEGAQDYMDKFIEEFERKLRERKEGKKGETFAERMKRGRSKKKEQK